jgi:hypothetical protein
MLRATSSAVLRLQQDFDRIEATARSFAPKRQLVMYSH